MNVSVSRVLFFFCLGSVVLLVACNEDRRPLTAADAATDTADPDATPDATPDAGPDAMPDAANACANADAEVVTLTTEDGIALEADFYTSGVAGSASVILLHMVPPANDRTNYDIAFIQLLRDRGLAVINVDRRGAGGSGGVAEEAYFGPNGKWDVKAAYDFLAGHSCGFDMSRVAIVGASNGTTSALDFTIYTQTEAEEVPAVLVFLTGGGYTEAQNRINNNRPLLNLLPILFVFSTAEADWSAQFVADEGPQWMFHEYTDGDHGTFMFQRRPDAMARVADFIQDGVTNP